MAYTEIVTFPDGIRRLRENIDPDCKYFTDDNFKNILSTCSMMIDRAAVKCFLGLIQKAKEKKEPTKVLWARTMLGRYEAELIQI
jgi:hypothetical protein